MKNFGDNIQFNIYQTMQEPDPDRLPVITEEWEERAGAVLGDGPYAYIAGGAGAERTMAANLAAFDEQKIIPRMLQNVGERDLEVELFGQTLPFPVLHAPIGVQSIIHPDGDLGSARACKTLGVPFITSSASTVPMEQIAQELGHAPRWFQLYWGSDPDVTASFLHRAEAAGYSAIVVTLDTPMMAWRERDLKNVYLPFLLGEGVGNYFSDPAFCAKLEKSPSEDPAAAIMHWAKIFGNTTLGWDDIAFLREQTSLPIILKGVLHPQDAKSALDHKVDGLIVSNHGGRQVDGAVAALDALPQVSEVVQGEIPILMDSGIRRGSDVIKALALGAQAVLVGRPLMYGLATAGERGVQEVLQNLIADFDITMALCGQKTVRDLSPAVLG